LNWVNGYLQPPLEGSDSLHPCRFFGCRPSVVAPADCPRPELQNQVGEQPHPPPGCPPFRGTIFDRNAELIVDNRASFDLFWSFPKKFITRRNFPAALRNSSVSPPRPCKTNLPVKGGRPLSDLSSSKRNLTREELAVIESNLFNLPGTMIQVKPQRRYMYNELASHVIGYLGEISEASSTAVNTLMPSRRI